MRLFSFLLTLFSLAGRFGYGFSSISKIPMLQFQPLPSTNLNSMPSSSASARMVRIGSSSSGAFVSHVPPIVVRHSSKSRLAFSKTSSSTSTLATSTPRGGGPLWVSGRTPFSTGTKCPMRNMATILGSLYGTFGVLYNLSKAIRRVIPIALEPFSKAAGVRPLTNFELGAYIFTCLWFAYVEGYRGFQKKLSPLVVKRSFSLIVGQSHPLHFLLAPYYSLGLFHATKKRMIVSWSVTVGIAAIVIAVKRLPYPWRNIIDAGVVAGLTWGSVSMLLFYIKSWITGNPPDIDPALPSAAAAAANAASDAATDIKKKI